MTPLPEREGMGVGARKRITILEPKQGIEPCFAYPPLAPPFPGGESRSVTA
jgi:hypothetical protein